MRSPVSISSSLGFHERHIARDIRIWRPLGESNPCCQDENLES